jgi:hypothetical protein
MNATQLNFTELENIQNIANGERCLAKTIANNILELNGVAPVVEDGLYLLKVISTTKVAEYKVSIKH